MSIERVKQNLKIMSALCPTWLQTCMFKLDGKLPAENELKNYLQFLSRAKEGGLEIKGVLLYGLARPSMQAEAPRLSALSGEWMNGFAHEIRALGFQIKVNP